MASIDQAAPDESVEERTFHGPLSQAQVDAALGRLRARKPADDPKA